MKMNSSTELDTSQDLWHRQYLHDSSLLRVVVCFMVTAWLYKTLQPSALDKFYRSQPLVGYTRSRWLRSTRASFESVFGTWKMVAAGYEKYSKADKSFLLPILLDKICCILPPSMLRELLNKSDDDVSDRIAHKEQLQSRYTFPPGILEDEFHFEMIRKQLTRKLPLVTSDLADELVASFEEYWPKSTAWTTVNIYALIRSTVARSANRVFAGSELCRNEIFLDRSRRFSQGVFAGALLINCVPKLLRPLIAPVVMLPNQRNFKACVKECTPIIKRRILATRQYQNSGSVNENEMPKDFLQWIIEECLARGDPSYLEPYKITGRLLTLNMVAIHTSSIVATNFVMELFSSPDAREYLSALRKEVEQVEPSDDESWTKDKVGQLSLIDSALRETMRLSTNEDYVVLRVVTNPQGVSFSNGIRVPKGAYMALPSRSIHLDPVNYPFPTQWDAYRFLKTPDGNAVSPGDLDKIVSQDHTTSSTQPTYQATPSLVTWTESFLGFGAGKNTCPGRFFAANELKLLVAQLLDRFDVEFQAQRTENMNIIGAWIPSEDLKLRVRARRQ